MLLKSKSFIILFFYSIILKIYIINSNEVVILPFNSSYKRDLFNEFSFIDDIQERNLYTYLKIGEKELSIKTILSFQHSYLALIPNKYTTLNKSSNTNYNFSESKTFKNITCLNEYLLESKNDILGNEKLKISLFNYKNNLSREIVLNDIKVVLGINDKYKENIYNLNIGLRVLIENSNKIMQDYNFIYQLKQRNITQDYYWFIYFEKGKKENGIFLNNVNELFYANGKLIIGDLPHNCQPGKFHKSQMLTTYSYYRNFIYTWALEFNNIYFYDKNNKIYKDTYHNVHLDINNYIAQAPNTYYFKIKNEYFNQYLNKGICNIYTGNGFEAIYCDKSEHFTINNLKQFPVLYFQNNELQYIFEFTYEDLFVEDKNKYWFLITFPIFYEVEEWFFGIIFLRKYNLIFNQDSKTISFYNPNLPLVDEDNSPNKNNKNDNNKIIIMIIILLGIIFISLGIYLGKIIYFNKEEKKRINELEDNFEYVSKEYSTEEKKDNNESMPMGI